MNLRFFLMLITAIGSGVSGGIFYAFSTFAIEALAQQPPAQGIATMQSMVYDGFSGNSCGLHCYNYFLAAKVSPTGYYLLAGG